MSVAHGPRSLLRNLVLHFLYPVMASLSRHGAGHPSTIMELYLTHQRFALGVTYLDGDVMSEKVRHPLCAP